MIVAKLVKILMKELLPYLLLLSSDIDKNHFLNLISKKTLIQLKL